MNPTLASLLTDSQFRRDPRGLDRELVTWRAPDDTRSQRLARATRRQLSGLFLAIGEHLRDEPLATDPAAAARPSD